MIDLSLWVRGSIRSLIRFGIIDLRGAQAPDCDITGTWYYGRSKFGRSKFYEVIKEGEKLFFTESSNGARGELVVDGAWLVAQLHHGQIRLMHQGGTIVSNFRKTGASSWGVDTKASRQAFPPQ